MLRAPVHVDLVLQLLNRIDLHTQCLVLLRQFKLHILQLPLQLDYLLLLQLVVVLSTIVERVAIRLIIVIEGNTLIQLAVVA